MGAIILAVLGNLCSADPPAPAPPPPVPEKPAPPKATMEQMAYPPSIRVVGHGSVSAPPDTAEVRLRLTTQDFSASSALRSGASAVESLRRRLREHGIAGRDVQKLSSSVVPQRSTIADPPARPEVAGYLARIEVRVRVRNLDRLGDVIDDGVNEGAEVAREISYSVADPGPWVEKARRRALADARRRAQAYARDAGMELGEILDIEERSADGGQGQPGESETDQEFPAAVAVTYSLRPKSPGSELESKEGR